MIGKLTGRLDSAGADGLALIDVRGVGYAVRMPQATLLSMRGDNEQVSLYIHTAVREDAIDLYGFLTEEELSFFRQLMSVSGIGPKSALSILNVSDIGTLKRGIAAGDAASLTKVFGIGKKSAERIVVELREKITIEVTTSPTHALGDGEVVEALMALGYSAQESRGALKSVAQDITGTRERLAAALKALGRSAGAAV